MRILLTNAFLANRTGSELYIRDVAIRLLRRGHTPIAFSPTLGPLSAELRHATIPTIDNLDAIGEPPDIIHGHHHLETMAALIRFPNVPAIYFCHGWLPWEEAPIRFPTIQRYVAVSETNRERLISEGGIPASSVSILPNFVDLDRFRPRAPLPSKPERALVFSNNIAENFHLPTIRRACLQYGISLDTVGIASANVAERPEDILGNYDLIFARGRAALESLAAGAAVILCDYDGLGPMVTTANFDQLRLHNLGLRVLSNPLEEGLVSQEIAKYDAHDAQLVCERARTTVGLDAAVDRLCQIYDEAMASFGRKQDLAVPADLVSQYLTWTSRTLHGEVIPDRDNYQRTVEALTTTQQQLQAQVEALTTAQQQLQAQVEALTSTQQQLQAKNDVIQADYAQLWERYQAVVYHARMTEQTVTWRLHQKLVSNQVLRSLYRFAKRSLR